MPPVELFNQCMTSWLAGQQLAQVLGMVAHSPASCRAACAGSSGRGRASAPARSGGTAAEEEGWWGWKRVG